MPLTYLVWPVNAHGAARQQTVGTRVKRRAARAARLHLHGRF